MFSFAFSIETSILCHAESQGEVLLPLTGLQRGEVKSRGEETVNECTEGQAIAPGGGKVLYGNTLETYNEPQQYKVFKSVFSKRLNKVE